MPCFGTESGHYCIDSKHLKHLVEAFADLIFWNPDMTYPLVTNPLLAK
jgi:hypothetical protein